MTKAVLILICFLGTLGVANGFRMPESSSEVMGPPDSQTQSYSTLRGLSTSWLDTDLDSSFQFITWAMRMAQKEQDSIEIAGDLKFLSQKAMIDLRYDLAIKSLLQAKDLLDGVRDQPMALGISLELAKLYGDIGDNEKALSFLYGPKLYFEQLGDTTRQIEIYSRLIDLFMQLGEVDSAQYFIEAGISLGRGHFESELPSIYYLKGMIKLHQLDTTQAVALIDSAMRIQIKYGDTRGLATKYVTLGQILLKQKAVAASFLKCDSAKLLAVLHDEKRALAEACKLEASLWDFQNDFQKAYVSYRKYILLDDSLRRNSPSQLTWEDREFYVERNQYRNARLAFLLDKSSVEVDEQRRWIILLVFTLFVSLFFSMRYLRILKKSRWAYKKLQETNGKVVRQSIEIAKAQEEIIKSEKMAFLGRIFAGIGHELNTPIAAVKSNLQLIEDAQMLEVQRYKELATDFTPEIFGLIHDLVKSSYQAQQHPLSTLRQRDLKKTLLSYFEKNAPKDSVELTDVFDELKIYDDIQRFEEIYQHPKGSAFLELVVYISNRTRSILTAMEALQRADKILFSLKSYSFKNLQDEKVTFDLIRNINTIITLHQNKLKEITVYKQFEEEILIEGYPDELTQVWSNLISNAAYANGYKGNIWIRVSQNDEEVRIDFEDSGGGIDPVVKEKIFEPFETTKPEGEGSGLGLSISKSVLEKHQGSIIVENTPNGAQFRIRIPKKRT